MPYTHQQLGQIRPSSANTPTQLYAAKSGIESTISSILVCNTSGASATFKMYNDDDGTDTDESTAIYWNITVEANQTLEITPKIMLRDADGEVSAESSVANALTFTAYGAETDA